VTSTDVRRSEPRHAAVRRGRHRAPGAWNRRSAPVPDQRSHTHSQAARARENALALLPELGTVPRRRRYHRLLQALVSLMAVALLVAPFGTVWAYQWWMRAIGPQEYLDTEEILSPEAVADFRAAAAADGPPGTAADPIVLTYHDINPDIEDSPYVVTPRRFAAQMAMLHEAGYRTMTAEEFTAFARGSYTPPPRSVLITFDDGTGGLYRHADPILAKYDFTAVSFIISGRVGAYRPYYLTWAQIDWMRDSGRWQFQSHTHDLHTEVPVGADAVASNLSNRLYDDGRRESLPAFQARVLADLEQSFRDFADHDLPPPTLFAWPFSDAGADEHETADAAAANYVQDQVGRRFDVSFIDNRLDALPATADSLASEVVQRLEVMRQDTARSVFESMRRMQTLPVIDLRPTEVDRTWLELSGHPAPLDLHGEVVQADADTLTYVTANWAVQRTSMWSDYAVGATLSGMATGRDTAGLRVRVEHAGEVTVQVSAQSARIEQGDRVLAEIPVAQGPHTVRVEVSQRATTAFVDGRLLGSVDAPQDPRDARGGFGIVASRASTGMPFPALHDLHVQPL
jgi:biofilm PGA synthesis lipoprotein PgaB